MDSIVFSSPASQGYFLGVLGFSVEKQALGQLLGRINHLQQFSELAQERRRLQLSMFPEYDHALLFTVYLRRESHELADYETWKAANPNLKFGEIPRDARDGFGWRPVLTGAIMHNTEVTDVDNNVRHFWTIHT